MITQPERRYLMSYISNQRANTMSRQSSMDQPKKEVKLIFSCDERAGFLRDKKSLLNTAIASNSNSRRYNLSVCNLIGSPSETLNRGGLFRNTASGKSDKDGYGKFVESFCAKLSEQAIAMGLHKQASKRSLCSTSSSISSISLGLALHHAKKCPNFICNQDRHRIKKQIFRVRL
ncbi:uncharacterized protein LOC115627598 [Scaptodrosophila lebanonensis]|uniref:Uncharacterized protein LOC115627598 n=1 Tax=Drosophila lebanonensis TaxID=7225 RepID=A0A6J2TWA6_DROLE|nr:uncharacterized protein LOC115627598 [Scaptodrosophila lebanonensis]